MADRWHFDSATSSERALFRDLASTLALAAEPAGPPNRLRHVVRLQTPLGVYYLKTFLRTQWRNRLRFLLTRPRAGDDADRERQVTAALRSAGHLAPRPVAWGRRGAASFYLCAALPGVSLHAWLQRHPATAELVRRVAGHCGRLLGAGFLLPDLSAEHVFSTDFTSDAPLAVLDLHNGRLARPGHWPRRFWSRLLRRFGRSVRDLDVPRRAALRFAARLLAAAGVPNDLRRRTLCRLPPWETAARYEASGKSGDYAARNPSRHRRELELLRRLWPGRPGELVLDMPCGTGRLLPELTRHFQHEVLQADRAMAMLRESAALGRRSAAVRADALAMPFAARAVDGVVVFRFLHHLPHDAQQQVIAEACRTARRFVVVSFFHPCSAHQLQRSLARWFGGRTTRFPTAPRRLRAWFHANGFDAATFGAEAAYRRDLWIAVFVRQPAAESAAPAR